MWIFGEQLGSSKVARRLVLLFVFAALIPICTLSILAFDQVSATLQEQGEERVRRACKSAGMSVLGSLRDTELTLNLLAEMQLQAHNEDSSPIPAVVQSGVGEYFVSLAIGGTDRGSAPILGSATPLPNLSKAGRTRLALGKTVLTTRARGDGSVAVLMLTPLDPTAPGNGWLMGELDAARLKLAVADGALPPLGEFCLFDQHGAIITCSAERIDVDTGDSIARSGGPTALIFDWQRGRETYLAAHRTIFLESLFGADGWQIVLGEPHAAALGSLSRFRAFFPLVVLVFLGVACLLCISQLRRSLAPLARLQLGTLGIAAGKFDTRIDVSSGDEFEQLADSFNGMAAKLAEQFGFLETMVEIDRAVLSKTEAGGIAQAILERIRDLLDCDMAIVALVDANVESRILIHLSHQSDLPIEVMSRDAPSADEVQRVLGLHDSIKLHLRDLEVGHPLDFLADAGMQACLVLPLRADSMVFGAVVLAFRDPDREDMAGYVHARQVVGQASVALQNAKVLEQNKVLAYYDNLTALPNRLMFTDRLEQALLDAERKTERLAICLLDLDGFKQINDTFGHDAGDQILKEQGRRIASGVRTGSVARLGGDEFTILIRDFDRSEVPGLIMKKILADLMRPLKVRTQEVVMTASVGIAVYPDDGETGDDLLKNADSAMYHAKKRGRNNYQFYTEAMTTAAMDRLEYESQLRGALERNELFVEFQPVFEVDSMRTVGAEALLRWRSPTRGIVAPSQFIPIMEETGLIIEIGKWVLRRACTEAAALSRPDLEPLHVAVNVSARQFCEPDFPAVVEAILAETDLPPQQLVLEMTESILIESVGDTLRRLKELRRVGVRLSIDDFGTGYSSLSYLKYFPIDFLKIDRTFIADLARSADNTAITKAIIAMAHSLSLEIIAEGVETEAQLEFLRREACQYAQGFIASASLAPADLAKYLKQE